MIINKKISTTALDLGKGLIHLLFPRLCEGCRKPLIATEELICLSCEEYISRTNYHHLKNNETTLRLSGRVVFQHATSFAYFTNQSLLQHLIHGLKYKGKQHNGMFLGKELGKQLLDEQWNVNAIIPVPLHKKKFAKRGFNQSEYIAEGVAEIMNLPIITNAVVRNRFTETQTDKTREQRIENVANAFSVKNASLVNGKHLLLIDDVLTTGATLESCALALLSVPNVTVSIATVGIAN